MCIVVTAEDAPDEALVAARALTRAHPDHWLAWLVRGLVSAQTSLRLEADRAAEILARLRELAPSQPYAWLSLAALHEARGEKELASKAAAYAQRLQPGNLGVVSAGLALLVRQGECAAVPAQLALLEEAVHALGSEQLAEYRALAARCTGGDSLTAGAEHPSP